MLYVLKTQSNDVIVFDSITSFSESYAGSVTSHPIEGGSKINDHMLIENPKFKINGVVSDYNFFNPIKDIVNSSVPVYDYDRAGKLATSSTLQGGYLEDSYETAPDKYNGVSNDTPFSVFASVSSAKERIKSINRNRELITIIPYNTEGSDSAITPIDNCVITDVSFDESPDNGMALYCSLSIEQVTFVSVTIIQADAPKILNQKLKDQAADLAKKGAGKGATATDAVNVKKADKHQPTQDAVTDEAEKARCINEWDALQAKGNMTPPQCAIDLGLKWGRY